MRAGMSRPKVLFLTRFGRTSAVTRYRSSQFLPFLRAVGFDCHEESLFPDTYLRAIYKPGSRRLARLRLLPLIFVSYARRWWTVAIKSGHYDVLHLQYEALPFLPLAFERSMLEANRRVVVDFDDPVFLSYQCHPSLFIREFLGEKIAEITRRSKYVTVANSYLASWASRLNTSVSTIPTSLDLTRYPAEPRRRRPSERLVIGWIGTPVTAKYLALIAEPLRILRRRHDFVFKVVGAPGFTLPGVDVIGVPWHESTEVEELRSFNIGIAPLFDDPWSRGKSALKLVQLLAAGVPAVASPVGANREVVSDGVNGLLAESPQEWIEKLSALIEQPSYGHELARAGRQVVEESHSLIRTAPRFVEVIRRAAS